MKMALSYYIAVLVIAAVTSVDSVTPTNELLEDQILSVLNKWHEGGVETNLFPLPSLNTIDIIYPLGHYDERGIQFTFSFGDIKLRGLDNFTVEYLKITQTLDDVHLFMEVIFPVLTISSENYQLKGRYFFYTLKGFGKMSAQFRNVNASISFNFASDGDASMKIADFVMKFSVGSVNVDLKDSSWPINQVLNKEGVAIINSYHEDIVSIIQNYFEPYANGYLAKITLRQFLDIATNIGETSYVIYNNI